MKSAILAGLCALVLGTGGQADPFEGVSANFGKLYLPMRSPEAQADVPYEFPIELFDVSSAEPVTNYAPKHPLRQAARAVGRLDVLIDSERVLYCTAVIVDDRHLLTSDRCLPGPDAPAAFAVQFVAGYADPHDTGRADRFAVAPVPVEIDRALGYAALRVFGDPGRTFGMFELSTDSVGDGAQLFVFGHPMARSLHITREGCRAALPAQTTAQRLDHLCDAPPGFAGAAVVALVGSGFRLVALHRSGTQGKSAGQAVPMSSIVAKSGLLKACGTPAGCGP